MSGYIGNAPSAVPLTSADIADGIITSAKITNGTIAIADLSATGTADATTFLRGDNTFASAGATAGQVIQVVSATFSTQSDSNSASFVATGLTASITPSSASNKILILYSLPLRNPSSSNINVTTTIFKNGSNLLGSFGAGIFKTDSLPIMAIATANYLDSPATTSSTTYAIFVNPTSVLAQWCGGSSTASITLLEIKV